VVAPTRILKYVHEVDTFIVHCTLYIVHSTYGSIGRIANLIQPPASFVGSPLRGGTRAYYIHHFGRAPMLFSSITFLYVFLPITLGLYYLVPRGWKNHVLLAASLIFYATGEPKYVILLILSGTMGWLHGIAFEKYPHNKLILISGMVWNLAFLLFFKYADFLIGSVNGLLGIYRLENKLISTIIKKFEFR